MIEVSVDHPAADKSYAGENESADSHSAVDSSIAEDTDHGSTDNSDGNLVESPSTGGYYYPNFVFAFSSSDPDSCAYHLAQWHGSLELGK